MASINDGKDEYDTFFIKLCSFGAQNAAIDDKGHIYVWGLK